MIEILTHIIYQFIKTLGLGGVFASMFIENIGIPLPTELGYLLGQEYINTAKYSFEIILLITTLGHVVGSVLSYWVGRMGDSYVRRRLSNGGKLKRTHDVVVSWYKKYGIITVFMTRFVGYVRPWSSFVAGFAKVDFLPFLLWTSLGALIFNIICLYFTSIFLLIWKRYEIYHIYMVGIMFFLFFGFIIYEITKYIIAPKIKTTK